MFFARRTPRRVLSALPELHGISRHFVPMALLAPSRSIAATAPRGYGRCAAAVLGVIRSSSYGAGSAAGSKS